MGAGDITITTPPTVPTLPLAEIDIIILPGPAALVASFFEGGPAGKSHVVRITNAGVTGFDLAAGVFTDFVDRPALATGYLTTILGVLFVGDASSLNARKSAFTNRLKADGVITVTGTVA